LNIEIFLSLNFLKLSFVFVLGLKELALNFAFVDALLKLELLLFPTPFLHFLLANQDNVRQGFIDDVMG
jgi:hypothetical protein